MNKYATDIYKLTFIYV